jgi:hypothetical protein
MDSQTFSRSFLKGLKKQCDQEILDNYIQRFIHIIQKEAKKGQTSYMFDLNGGGQLHIINWEQAGMIKPSNDDFISAFKRRFPDCDISYQETWVELNSKNKELKQGIVIDWS